MTLCSIYNYGSKAQGLAFLAFGSISFLVFVYAAVVSKLLLPFENPILAAIQNDRYVHPTKSCVAVDTVLFPTAIHLSQGSPLALAPAVLARIYRDLRLLKQLIMPSDKCKEDESGPWFGAPLQFVQLWAWERFFANLQLKPNVISYGEPRVARWHMVKIQRRVDPRSVIGSAAGEFLWRPYVINTLKNWDVSNLYKEKDEYVIVGPNVGREILMFTRFIRASELVGLDCIEQYHPHRVSMQFGFDQDVPGCVNHACDNPKTAWSNYTRPIKDAKLYIPCRLFQSDVSGRYLEWWNNQKVAPENAVKHVITKGKRSKTHERMPRMSWGHYEKINAFVPCGSVSKCDEFRTVGNIKYCEMEVVESSDDDDSLTIADILRRKWLMQKGISVPDNQEPLPSTQCQSSSALNDGTARQRETLVESKNISEKHETSNRNEGDEPYVVKEMMPQESKDNNVKGSCKLNLPESLELASEDPNSNRSDGGYTECLSTSPAKMTSKISKASMEAPTLTVSGTNIAERNYANGED